jgi:hypothetical protein
MAEKESVRMGELSESEKYLDVVIQDKIEDLGLRVGIGHECHPLEGRYCRC